jgi:hypothetical protein
MLKKRRKMKVITKTSNLGLILLFVEKFTEITMKKN